LRRPPRTSLQRSANNPLSARTRSALCKASRYSSSYFSLIKAGAAGMTTKPPPCRACSTASLAVPLKNETPRIRSCAAGGGAVDSVGSGNGKGRRGGSIGSGSHDFGKVASEDRARKFMRQFLRGLAKIAPIVPSLFFEEAEGCPGISTSSMAAHEPPKDGE